MRCRFADRVFSFPPFPPFARLGVLALLALLQQVPEEGPWTPYGIDKQQFRAVREVFGHYERTGPAPGCVRTGDVGAVFAGLGQPLEVKLLSKAGVSLMSDKAERAVSLPLALFALI